MQQEESSQRGSDEEMNMVSASIEKLQDYNVNAADINKLKNAGICTVKGLLMATKKELTNIKGISDQKIDKMIEAAENTDIDHLNVNKIQFQENNKNSNFIFSVPFRYRHKLATFVYYKPKIK